MKLLLTLLLALAVSAPARAEVRLPDAFADELVVSGLASPTGMAFLPDGRLLVVEQKTGALRLVVRDALAPVDPVGIVPQVHGRGGERGLLGIAVDPGWPSRPYVYVHGTSLDPDSVIRISRFALTGDLDFVASGSLALDVASRREVIAGIPDFSTRHNGGTLRFGMDGMLYASVGDDVLACAAQDSSSLHGAILRLDVTGLPDGPGGAPDPAAVTPPDNPFVGSASPAARLVWAFGLRNPFRFHVDPATGDLFVGDVGETTWEEVDRVTGSGPNLGWPLWEGPDESPFAASCDPVPNPPNAIWTYDRTAAFQASVITAGVCRVDSGEARAFPADYDGALFVGDYFQGFLTRLVNEGGSWRIADPVAGQPSAQSWADGLTAVSDWLFGPDGALWYCKQSTGGSRTGQIHRIVPASSIPGGGDSGLGTGRGSVRESVPRARVRLGAARVYSRPRCAGRVLHL